jgi:prevent-host-death family protein
MQTIGAYQAKTNLPQLLERVARGETITITRRGKPIARLTPLPAEEKPDVESAIARMRAFRDQEGPTLGPDLTIRDLVDEGRRC